MLSKLDTLLFIFYDKINKIFVFAYVDDLFVTGSSSTFIDEMIHDMKRMFHVHDVGSLHFSLELKSRIYLVDCF